MSIEQYTIFKFSSDDEKKINCYHSLGQHLYLGSGNDGIVYRTKDGYNLFEFYKIDDTSVNAIIDYKNALFIGSSSNGCIYMHNFSTGNRFKYVVTGDYSVSSFCVFEDKLYVGTSPSGLILSFDGNKWKKEYQANHGIVSMNVLGNTLCVFVNQVSYILGLKNGEWEFIKYKNGDKEEMFSIYSYQKIHSVIFSNIKEKESDHSFSCSAKLGDKVLFAPQNRANLYMYDGENISILYKGDGKKISSIETIGDEQIFMAIGDSVYYAEVKHD